MPRGFLQSDRDSCGVNNPNDMFANLGMNSTELLLKSLFLYNNCPTVLHRSLNSESYPVWNVLVGTSCSRTRALVYPSGCSPKIVQRSVNLPCQAHKGLIC